MIGCGRFCIVIIPFILSLLSILLAILACVGSTSTTTFIEDTHFIRMNFSSVALSDLFGTSSQLPATATLSDVGIKEVYSLGMWGYCSGSISSTDASHVDYTFCSKPKAMYGVNITEIISNDLNSAYTALAASITLPTDITDAQNKFNTLSKAIFITCIIGIVSTFLLLLFTLFSFCSHIWSCIASIFGVIAFLGLIVSAAGSTALFMVIRAAFNNNFDTLGIKAYLDMPFYALIWSSAMGVLLTVLFVFIGICCGTTSKYGRVKEQKYAEDQQPMMAYHPH
ncbi:hypothetical protein BABINDRAFT_9099 [Babjeviella inositovora NRRL Y-12698]|uniref:Uncharacterized protein n=1 Tax=Babjeviella inositovora NRRL Y-12698 TaxID=984486 RepID=A0A1E3QMD1_9ASCO|nr:uncharacterized protein BABINDRAFT_9099 [Babjeviella inositovora NRRL Y-12698]ODQ78869.1 hypothetical protein BABINDRAFT_9099 [Babjeviella inositovora NRRL Y-12698]